MSPPNTVNPLNNEINLAVSESAQECVGTDGIYPSIGDLGDQYKIVLRVDAPQQSLLDNLVNDVVSVAWQAGTMP